MNFDDVFDRVIGHEAGYVDDPNDPGGKTKWGISQRSYPDEVIEDLTRDDAKRIYGRDFWERIHGDRLIERGFDGVSFVLMDFAVNSGVETAVRYLQRAIGVADDGHWGPVSQAALERHNNESDIIMLLTAERMDFQTKLKNWPSHGKGWTRRNAQNLRYGAADS